MFISRKNRSPLVSLSSLRLPSLLLLAFGDSAIRLVLAAAFFAFVIRVITVTVVVTLEISKDILLAIGADWPIQFVLSNREREFGTIIRAVACRIAGNLLATIAVPHAVAVSVTTGAVALLAVIAARAVKIVDAAGFDPALGAVIAVVLAHGEPAQYARLVVTRALAFLAVVRRKTTTGSAIV